MPYKSEKLKLPPSKDRRRKLTDEQKEEIKRIYAEGKCGTRSLAKQFGVSRSTIQVIVNPAIKQRHHNYVKEHWRDWFICATTRLLKKKLNTFRRRKKY